VLGGTAAASAIAIFLIPVTFYVVEKVARRKRKKPGARVGEDADA
jgi:hypothetical protein